MILVFGTLTIDILIQSDPQNQTNPQISYANSYHKFFGGTAANIALAAAREDTKAALVTKIGDEPDIEKYLTHLRAQSVVTSSIARTEKTSATRLYIDQNAPILALGACADLDHEQLPQDILTDKHWIVVQDDLPWEKSAPLLQKAKAQNAKTALYYTGQSGMDEGSLAHCDFIIGKESDLSKLSAPADKMIKIPPLKDTQAKLGNHPMWGENVFVGTLIASMYKGLSKEKSITRATIAGSLACHKDPGQNGFPYSSDIDDALKKIQQ